MWRAVTHCVLRCVMSYTCLLYPLRSQDGEMLDKVLHVNVIKTGLKFVLVLFHLLTKHEYYKYIFTGFFLVKKCENPLNKK